MRRTDASTTWSFPLGMWYISALYSSLFFYDLQWSVIVSFLRTSRICVARFISRYFIAFATIVSRIFFNDIFVCKLSWLLYWKAIDFYKFIFWLAILLNSRTVCNSSELILLNFFDRQEYLMQIIVPLPFKYLWTLVNFPLLLH